MREHAGASTLTVERATRSAVAWLSPLAAGGAHATAVGPPVELQAVVPAHRQQILDHADDTAGRTHKGTTE